MLFRLTKELFRLTKELSRLTEELFGLFNSEIRAPRLIIVHFRAFNMPGFWQL